VILLDSSAVLAMLQGELGADRVVSALASDSVAISAANPAEVRLFWPFVAVLRPRRQGQRSKSSTFG
jgi:PIN domain nuclease of toxin-antitoxin system